MAERFKTDHYEKKLHADIRDLVQRLAGILDEPLGDFSNFPTYLVSCTAREKVTVALSGDGGDEIFGGYEHYLAQKMARFIDHSPLQPAERADRRRPAPAAALAIEKGLGQPRQAFRRRAGQRPGQPSFPLDALSDGAAENPPLRSVFPAARASCSTCPSGNRSGRSFSAAGRFAGINQDLYLDLKTYLADDIMVKVDRMSMAASLEARAPLLDRKLVEFAFSLPPGWKVRGGTGKWFFKKAMAGILDEKILNRQKQGFSIPIKNWLKERAEGIDAGNPFGKKDQRHGLFFLSVYPGPDP